MLVAANSESDLPVFPLLNPASKHDSLGFLETWFRMKSFLPDLHVSKWLLDSAHDAMPYYLYCRKNHIQLFIDLNVKRGMACFSAVHCRFESYECHFGTIASEVSFLPESRHPSLLAWSHLPFDKRFRLQDLQQIHMGMWFPAPHYCNGEWNEVEYYLQMLRFWLSLAISDPVQGWKHLQRPFHKYPWERFYPCSSLYNMLPRIRFDGVLYLNIFPMICLHIPQDWRLYLISA